MLNPGMSGRRGRLGNSGIRSGRPMGGISAGSRSGSLNLGSGEGRPGRLMSKSAAGSWGIQSMRVIVSGDESTEHVVRLVK
jgi:hypothetical protein